ncbi:hypothetical protein Pmani_023938 [Petrolisthes manimaculis]|uniref:Uncharacterized protein n=1 Tax=Petrolisthes manimaculis TaxID=1843537 RepID=A0AAE1TZ72_9EUCA|nr:hypothetical protein Pmani_023938 [Petrolisthes manimaculis]
MYKSLAKVRVKIEVKPIVENLVFRLHYRYTYVIFMASCLLTTMYGLFGDYWIKATLTCCYTSTLRASLVGRLFRHHHCGTRIY